MTSLTILTINENYMKNTYNNISFNKNKLVF